MSIDKINIGLSSNEEPADSIRDAFNKTNNNFDILYYELSNIEVCISGTSGTSGTSGINGKNGKIGNNGTSGTSGTSGLISGTSGTDGARGIAGVAGTSGIDGSSGADGYSGINGTSGNSGNDDTSGNSGIDGTSGGSGTNGTSGSSGKNGTSGRSGINAISGSSGKNGTSGIPYAYKLTIKKSDINWDNEWIVIPTTIDFNSYRITDVFLSATFGYGTVELIPIIKNIPALRNQSDYKYYGFYIKDVDGFITKNGDFSFINISFNVTSSDKNYDTLKYILGENVINDHYNGDEYHSHVINLSFDASYKQLDGIDFSGIKIETVYDELTNGSLYTAYTPRFCSIRDANLVMKPYVNGANTEELYSNPNILSVASHYDNNYLRVDITGVPNIFLKNSIAVVARPNDVSDFFTNTGNTDHHFTSYGYGAEFLEVASTYGMNQDYNVYTNPYCFGWGILSGDTQNIIVNQHTNVLTFAPKNIAELEIGSRVAIGPYLDSEFLQISTVVEFVGEMSMRVSDNLQPLQTGVTNYIYAMDSHIGTHWQPRRYVDYPLNTKINNMDFWQSPTTGLIAGKFKKIRMLTDVSWNLVREAARETAYLANNTFVLTSSLSGGSGTTIYLNDTTYIPKDDPTKVTGTLLINGVKFHFKYKTSNSVIGDIQQLPIAESGTTVKLKWDIFRGFGVIDVQAAIDYINTNYKSSEYRNILADYLEGERSINNLLEYEDLYPNSPISKKMIKDISEDMAFRDLNEDASALNVGKIRYRTVLDKSVSEICMKSGASAYEWVVINENNW